MPVDGKVPRSRRNRYLRSEVQSSQRELRGEVGIRAKDHNAGNQQELGERTRVNEQTHQLLADDQVMIIPHETCSYFSFSVSFFIIRSFSSRKTFYCSDDSSRPNFS